MPTIRTMMPYMSLVYMHAACAAMLFIVSVEASPGCWGATPIEASALKSIRADLLSGLDATVHNLTILAEREGRNGIYPTWPSTGPYGAVSCWPGIVAITPYMPGVKETAIVGLQWYYRGVTSDAPYRLNGVLPDDVTDLSKLKEIHFADNKIAGTLPVVWSKMTALESLRLDRNLLTGTIPAAWSNMKSLTLLDVSEQPMACYPQPAWLKAWAAKAGNTLRSTPPKNQRLTPSCEGYTPPAPSEPSSPEPCF
jgi:hypothetical protein